MSVMVLLISKTAELRDIFINMLVDETKILVEGGKGGSGAVSFLREKYRPKGGPDGGDGGDGGKIIFKVDHNLASLSDLDRIHKFKAEDGAGGEKNRRKGKNGDDLIISAPLGTEVYHNDKLIIDLTNQNQIELIAKGGQGGWGNWHFKSSIKQSPMWSKQGLIGEKRELKLNLKLIADVGIIGLPNAGKSTLLSVISNARPKIASYPFTTLDPNLGVVKLGKKELIFADLPGLIEGAHLGKGLGDRFLRHLERTRIILHLIPADSQNLVKDYQIIQNELTSYSPKLAKKPQIIIVSKREIVKEKVLHKEVNKLKKATKRPVFSISASTNDGLEELISKIFITIDSI